MENDDVTVLLVWNGPGVLHKWQLYCALQCMKRDRGDGEKEENDGGVPREMAIRRRER